MGVEFDPVDTQAHPEGYEELARLGIQRVPALTIGDRAAHGWNPPAYAELLGIPYSETIKLAPAVLAQRLDIVLDTNQQLMGIVPERHLNWRPPERNRTLRNLGYHVFRLSLAFVDGMDLGEFPNPGCSTRRPTISRTVRPSRATARSCVDVSPAGSKARHRPSSRA